MAPGLGLHPVERLPTSPTRQASNRQHTHFSTHLLTTDNDNRRQTTSGETHGIPLRRKGFHNQRQLPTTEYPESAGWGFKSLTAHHKCRSQACRVAVLLTWRAAKLIFASFLLLFASIRIALVGSRQVPSPGLQLPASRPLCGPCRRLGSCRAGHGRAGLGSTGRTGQPHRVSSPSSFENCEMLPSQSRPIRAARRSRRVFFGSRSVPIELAKTGWSSRTARARRRRRRGRADGFGDLYGAVSQDIAGF